MGNTLMISIQEADFDVGAQTKAFHSDAPKIGAICCFTGLVRDFGDRTDLLGLYLEHYPGMTEKALEKIIEEAKTKWPIYQVQIIHRVGNLDLGDQIVFVGVSSAHREAAFQACEFLMDYLKVDAPFWKKERTKSGDHWVEQKASDQKRASRW
jgi:molybdopterin synthase catalytic subunit